MKCIGFEVSEFRSVSIGFCNQNGAHFHENCDFWCPRPGKTKRFLNAISQSHNVEFAKLFTMFSEVQNSVLFLLGFVIKMELIYRKLITSGARDLGKQNVF